MANTPSIKKNFIISSFYELLCVITPFITAPYVSRVLGAEKIGIWSYTNSIESYFTMFAVLGTATYGAREISRSRKDKKLNSKLFWEIELLSVITSFFCLIFWGIFVFQSGEYKIYYLILTINLLSAMFDISWFYKGLEEFKYTVTKNMIVKLSVLILLFTFVKKPEHLWLYFIFQTSAAFLGNLSMWISLKKFLVPVNIKELKIFHHFSETIVYFIPTIATSIYQVLDKTLIGIITKDPKQNGYYEQANRIISIVKSLSFKSICSVAGARVSLLFAEEKFDEIKQRINKSMDLIMFLCFGCCFGIIGVAKTFVPVFFGKGYETVIPILQLLSPVVIIISISSCLSAHYYTPAGLRSKSCYFEITGAIVNLTINLILIPRLETIGAVIGTLIAETVITTLYIIFSNHYLTLKSFISFTWKKIIASLIMLFIILCVQIKLSNPYISLVIQILAGGISYIIILIILKDSIFNLIINKLINKIRFRGNK